MPLEKILGGLWFSAGLILASLNALNIVKIGILSVSTLNCAQVQDVSCLSNGIIGIVNFGLNILIGPLLLISSILNSSFFTIFALPLTFIIILILALGTFLEIKNLF